MKTTLKTIALLLLTTFSATAAIESITIEKVNGVDVYSRPTGASDVTYPATNGNWNANNFNDKIPVVPGSNYTILVVGNFLDTWSSMEVKASNGTTSFSGVTVTSASKFTINGKGATRWLLTVGSGITDGSIFMVRHRYAIETNVLEPLTGENIKFEAVNKANITNVSITPAPIRNGSTLNLRPDVLYTLTFTLTGNTGSAILYTGTTGINNLSGGSAFGLGFQSNSSFPSNCISANSSTTFSMQIKAAINNPSIISDLKDYRNLGFALIDSDVDAVFRGTSKSYHVASTFGTLSNTAPNTNLSSIAAGVSLPNIVSLKPTSRGTLYNFGTATVTDAQSRIYKNIVIPSTPDNTNLGTLLSTGGVLSDPSKSVSRVLGTDATLGTITLHEIMLGTYTFPISNDGSGIVNATIPFTNRFSGNLLVASQPSLPSSTTLSRRTIFPVAAVNVNNQLPSLAVGIVNNSIVYKSNIQVFTFSNRPGLFYCDNAWPIESSLSVFVDVNNNIDEVYDGSTNNLKVY